MFQTILVPLDGSALAERAINPAIELARHTDGRIIFLTAPVYTDTIVTSSAAYGMAMPTLEGTTAYDEAQEYLGNLCRARACDGVTLEMRVVDGVPADTIIATARREQADLIVMSTHGRSGLARVLMGSVTEDVLHSAPCPVLVIRE